jgi:hypothetical protein
MPPTTTTEALPLLGELDAVKTSLEAKALLLLTDERPISAEDQPLADVVEQALNDLVAGTITSDQFFELGTAAAPDGTAFGSYLICNVETYFDPSCEATPASYAESFAGCAALPTASLFEFLVEGDRWAAVTGCVWRPTEADLSAIRINAPSVFEQETNSVGRSDPEIELLAQERADFFVANPDEIANAPVTPEGQAIRQRFQDEARGNNSGCGDIRLFLPGEAPTFIGSLGDGDAVVASGAGFARFGTGVAMAQGSIMVTYCWFTV